MCNTGLQSNLEAFHVEVRAAGLVAVTWLQGMGKRSVSQLFKMYLVGHPGGSVG